MGAGTAARVVHHRHGFMGPSAGPGLPRPQPRSLGRLSGGGRRSKRQSTWRDQDRTAQQGQSRPRTTCASRTEQFGSRVTSCHSPVLDTPDKPCANPRLPPASPTRQSAALRRDDLLPGQKNREFGGRDLFGKHRRRMFCVRGPGTRDGPTGRTDDTVGSPIGVAQALVAANPIGGSEPG